MQIRRTFLVCSEFTSDDSLRSIIIANDTLSSFCIYLPDATKDRNERVDKYLSFLLEKRLIDGTPLLLPFLKVLRDRQPEEGNLRGKLNTLLQEIETIFHD